MSYVAYQKFWRVAGVDHMHVNGLQNKFCEDDDSVIASAKACLTPMFNAPGRGCEVMPVFSSGQWGDPAQGRHSGQAQREPESSSLWRQRLVFLATTVWIPAPAYYPPG